MNEIISAIRKNIETQSGAKEARFVFHSETAALFWAQKALNLSKIKTIGRGRFIAWDVFKEENLSVNMPGRSAASRPIRLLFARSLCLQNAASSFLSHLIPPDYAKDGIVFASNISPLLPKLALLQKKIYKSPDLSGGMGFFADFEIIHTRYKNFLESNNLFEPSWEKPPFKDNNYEYYIFYPELIEDYAEYEELLNSENVHKIEIKLKKNDDDTVLNLYPTTRDELKAAALEIKRLKNEKNIQYEQMALSVAGLDVLEPYIKRELEIYGIPFNVRSGKALSEYPPGKFFSLINNCVQNNFSWNSLQALLTNTGLPWRAPNKNTALLRFGIKRNCVSGYRHRGIKRDAWEEAFYTAKNKEALANHYKKLKRKMFRITSAKTFDSLYKRSRNFFAHLFKKARDDEASRIMGRCLNELSALVLIEKKYPAIHCDAPLEVFNAVLKEKIHVRETEKTGINVFNYGVAASIPCAAHFVINASQSAAAKLFSPLGFLGSEKKALLQAEDKDVSEEYFKSFRQIIDGESGENMLYISASTSSFSGAQIPHTYYSRPAENGGNFIRAVRENAAEAEAEIYLREKNWWAGGAAFPPILLPLQKNGFAAWSFFYKNPGGSFLEEPVTKESAAANLISKKISFINGKTQISATSLNLFFKCPILWLYNKIYKLKKYNTRAKMLDDENRGILYHEILYAVFKKIKDTDGVFISARINDYIEWTKEIALRCALSFKMFRGPLAGPLMESMSLSIARNIRCLLENEAALRDGWGIAGLEETFNMETERLFLTGKMDRISISPDYIPLIVDYKSGAIPAKKDCVYNDTNFLQNFQIALYIKLYENSTNVKVENAVFISAVNGKSLNVLGGARNKLKREEYQQTLDIMELYIERYAQSVSSHDYAPRAARPAGNSIDFSRKKIPLKTCVRCEYRPICRTVL